MKTNLGTKTI